MSRTRLRQLEQVRNSLAYDDGLNSGDFAGAAAEGQPGGTIGTANSTVASVTSPATIIVSGDFVTSGANVYDRITITNGPNDGIFATISSLSYSSGPNQTTFTVVDPSSALTTDSSVGVTATVTVDPNKNLRRDLDFVRTQLRKLNNKPNWYDDPAVDPVVKYQLVTGSPISAGTDIPLTGGETFDAGEPYTFKVYLNGVLTLPSTVVSNAVTVSNDYIERDSSQPVGVGEVGNRIRFNFDLVSSDILQFKWTKTQ